MILKTEDPGVRGVRKAVKNYIKSYPDFEKAITLYSVVMEAQQKALEKIKCVLEMAEDEIAQKLVEGKSLLDRESLQIDPGEFQGLVKAICDAVELEKPGGFPHKGELLSWSGLNQENLDATRALVVSGGQLDLGADWPEEERRLASNILWETFSPFYRKYGSILEIELDHSLWQRGYCPICGGNPLMGKFRYGDGLWLLECSLCHSQWNIQRARCPFCENGSEGSLNYLYLDGNDSCRVQYCESCNFYVKTIDLRESERISLLPLEDIITMELDQAAREEGLKPASEYSALDS